MVWAAVGCWWSIFLSWVKLSFIEFKASRFTSLVLLVFHWRALMVSRRARQTLNENKESSLHLFLDFHGGMTRYCDFHAASKRDVRCETAHDWGWAQKGAAWQQPAVLGECTMHFKCLRTSCTCTAAFLGSASSSSCTHLRLPQLSSRSVISR